MARLNYLFLYCERLDSSLVKDFMPNAEFVTTATCEDHKVRFVSYVDDNGNPFSGGCCLTSAPGELLYGTLWKVAEEDLLRLDKLVNITEGRYTREYRAVMGADGKPYATVSHSIKHPTEDSKPSETYLGHMLAGAKEFRFPEEYIKKLERLK